MGGIALSLPEQDITLISKQFQREIFQESGQKQKGDIQYSVFFGFISLLLEGLQENAHRIHCSGKCQENSKTATPLRHFAKIALELKGAKHKRV